MVQPLDQFVDALRRVAQDVLVPEFRTVQSELRGQEKHLESVEHRLNAVVQELQSHGQVLLALDTKMGNVDRRLESQEQRLDAVIQRLGAQGEALASLNTKMDTLVGFIADYREVARLAVRVEALERDMASLKGRRN